MSDAIAWLIQQQLDDLRLHWDDAYDISHDGTMYVAKRKDNDKTLSAMDAIDLREMIRDNYARSPVSRESQGSTIW